jgi:hypothetical protein
MKENMLYLIKKRKEKKEERKEKVDVNVMGGRVR